ncbi:MAG TPA: sigma-70 family RNA polymerase sigma factor [Blastocatellia bacterium]|nr:sigma-70 family RNA polymerase sigma factor [Blastocatellia bacterium]
MAVPAEAFETDRRLLWGVCYRMTGNAADADDLVQETFVRALTHAPKRSEQPVRPWLIRVAMNLSLDLLRKRRRRVYVGEWLPSPVPTGSEENPASFDPRAAIEESPATRYEMLESVSFAFLLALEALTPLQRAVLLLRDVFDYSTEETGEALDIGEANVKVTLHRARRRMQEYDKKREALTPARREATRHALEQFLLCINNGDVRGLEQLLTEDIVTISDGGGKVNAALNPIKGRANLLRLIAGLTAKLRSAPRTSIHDFNGLPGILFEDVESVGTAATRYTVHIEVDLDGKIRRLDAVLAPDKLSAV